MGTAPQPPGTRLATFTALCATYRLDPPVLEAIMNSRIDDMQDFCYFWTRSEDVASFLASGESDYLTGISISVSGGMWMG